MTPASTKEQPRKRKSPKGEARRREILAVAREIFSEGGYNHASIADVAQRVGISQAGLLHHYPSKHDLLIAVLSDRDAEFDENQDEHDLVGIEAINSYLRRLRRHADDPVLLQLNTVITGEAVIESHPAHHLVKATYEKNIQALAETMAEAFDFDRMPEGVNSRTMAHWVVALSEGLRLQMLHHPDDVHRTELLRLFFETLRPYAREDTPFSDSESDAPAQQ